MGTSLRPEGCVLVVDDELGMRRILSKLLHREGYDVLTAENGQEALSILQQQAIDTVLLDVRMPTMDGLETCRMIRSNPRTALTPVVFLSAADDRLCRREAREAGANDFLSKPFDEAELRARVRSSIHGKRYQDRLTAERLALEAEVQGRTRALEEATRALERVRSELERAHHETLERLTRAAEFRDDETAAHLQRMSHYCGLLAHKRGLGNYDAELIRVASPMHDVGKIGIPDRILLKEGRLTPDEFELMKQHAEIGFRILSGSDSELLRLAASIARNHHEKWDGTGYPRGLQAEDIPIEGRIAAVADVFDALTSARPYKPAWTLADAIELLQAGRGYHFDPQLIDLFLSSLDEVLDIRERFQERDPH